MNLWTISGINIALALGLGGAVASIENTASPAKPVVRASSLLDFLVQDVCVDAADRAVAGDPANCRHHRNLKLGEKLPYIVTDFDHAARISLGSMSSIPVRATDGTTMVLVTKSLQGRYTPGYSFNYSPARDAFDLIDIRHSKYASIVRTFDGSCFDQLFSRNGNARGMANRAGGWILFPLAPAPSRWPKQASVPIKTWRVQLSAAGPKCASNQGSGITFWTAPTPYTFETGKILTAVRSDHFAAVDLAQPENSFERFYFTREYGMTRWESWWTVAHCKKMLGAGSARCGQTRANSVRTRCSVLNMPSNPISGLEQWGGQSWVRMDCRDSTRYVALARPHLPLSREIARGEGFIDIDYPATVNPR